MSYLELYSYISKPWCSYKEIMEISGCGRDSAIKIRNAIQESIAKKGKSLPTGKTIVVPTQAVIEYLGIDLDYVLQMTTHEMNIRESTINRQEAYAGISK